MSTHLNERRFGFRGWPAIFSQSRKPEEDQSFIESLTEHDPYTKDRAKLFMLPYEGDRTFFHVDVVTRFCRNVGIHDLPNQISSKKATAWLDDHPRPRISELAADAPSSAEGALSIAINHCIENTARPRPTPQDSSIENGGRESSTLENTASITPAALKPREYDQWLSAQSLHSYLHQKRFDCPGVEDADRRLIYIANPDRYDMLALIATAADHQTEALRALLWQFIDRQTSLKARIEPRGFRVFQLEAHLPCFALRKTPQEDLRKRNKQKAQQDWMDLSFLAKGGEDGVLGIYQAQFSFTVCGTDNSRWIAYALEANDFDTDRGDDTRCSEWRSDEIAMGNLNAHDPIQDPREYFLNVLWIRAESQLEETRELVLAIEASWKNHGPLRHPFSPMSGNNISSTFDWNESMLHLLQNLIPQLSNLITSWQCFASPGKDIAYFEDYSIYSPETREHLNDVLGGIQQAFEGMEALKKRLDDVENRCEKLAHRLESCLTRQSSQINHFTIIIISPVVIAAGVFAIPDPFVVYERNLLSFVLTIAIAYDPAYMGGAVETSIEFLSMESLERCLASLNLSSPLPTVTVADALANPLDLCRVHLAEILAGALDIEIEAAYKSVQWPNDIYKGDLVVVLPKLRPGAKADEVALELLEKFPKDDPLFLLPFADGVHFRTQLKPSAVPHLLMPYTSDTQGAYGCVSSNLASDSRKKVIVEFSSPNVTSEFQGKHLRSTTIGAFISRLYESMGWNVTRINYLGDWGKPIALLYVGWTKYGSDEAYEADPIGHLLDVYHKIEEDFKPEQAASKQARDEVAKEGEDKGEAQIEIETKGIFAERNEAFKKLEEGDQELVAFWKRIRDVNIDNYTEFYERLGVRFDEYTGESQIGQDTMTEVEQMLKEKNISEESGGAWIVHMQNLGAKAGTAIIRDRTGSSTYLLRDLAAVLERSRKYAFDKMIYVVASDNSVHFTQLIKVLEALDMKDLADKLQHVRFSETSKMATTLGKGYKPQGILDACEEAMKGFPESDADKIASMGGLDSAKEGLGTSALLIQELSTRSATTHAFDTSAMASFKLGSGPDLQYWLAKLHLLLKGIDATAEPTDEDYVELAEEAPANLLRVLAQYPEVVKATYSSLEPAGIVTYLASVTEQLAECLAEDDEDETEGDKDADVTPGLAALYEATAIVLENGMKLLGLTPIAAPFPERADTPVMG
ncbi:Nucleotidylyl transferase [Stemphylium lycopersici]|uniref:arginine--tRNA ligase n=1 Tax=Stemphylium lycopersici TaxID=183478 RepID=A0A364MVU0_STELY|nr:Nucleotidylyl transferase [Stemphylium lycopersici]RAR05871.1 Nucleotidylyl transferase [Stemphylium lycopersici]